MGWNQRAHRGKSTTPTLEVKGTGVNWVNSTPKVRFEAQLQNRKTAEKGMAMVGNNGSIW